MSFDGTEVLPASVLESLPVELLFKIASEVVLSTNPDPNQGHFPPITSTRRSGKIPTGIHAVSLTSRRLHNLANAVLYRTVVLDSEKDILLFGRTVSGALDATRSGRTKKVAITLTFLKDAVKRLAITYAPIAYADLACVSALRKPGMKMSNDVSTIVTACSGVHTIAIHSQWAPILCNIRKTADGSKSGDALIGPTLTELLLSSYADLAKTSCTVPPIAQWRPSAPSTPVHSLSTTPSGTRPSSPDPTMQPDSTTPNSPSGASIFGHVTRLRIAEPAYAWYSPLALLKVFTSLTHIALPRRAHANTENDELFIKGVKAILREPRIQVIVITIFPQLEVGADKELTVGHGAGGSMDVRDSTIWLAAEKLRMEDGRVFVTVNARMGGWRKDWQGQGVVASPDGPDNWWRKAMGS